MKQYTKPFTLAGNKQSGDSVEASNGNFLASVVVNGKAYNVWFPKAASMDKNITFNVHEKGDTFVAASDSKTSFGQLLESQGITEDELEVISKERKTTIELLKDEPVFSEGETVVRKKESVEWVGFASEATRTEDEEMSLFERKVAILAKHKVALGTI